MSRSHSTKHLLNAINVQFGEIRPGEPLIKPKVKMCLRYCSCIETISLLFTSNPFRNSTD